MLIARTHQGHDGRIWRLRTARLATPGRFFMTVMQVHESTRGYAARQIDAGRMSIKLLALRARISQPHASSFVHGRKRLSVAALSRVVAAIGFEAELFASDTTRFKN